MTTTIPPPVWLILLIIIANHISSWLVYNMTWWNSHAFGKMTPFGGATREEVKQSGSCFFRLLKRVRYYPVHLLLIWCLRMTYDLEIPMIVQLSKISSIVLTLSSVFRFGSIDLQHYFISDRLLCVTSCLLSQYYPMFLYINLLCNCTLQYSISSWCLAPPYSNYLSFEYVRISLINCIVVLSVKSVCVVELSESSWVFLFLLCGATYYLHQGSGKLRLGTNSTDWLLHNRGECIFVNSYLRGWWSQLLSKKVVLIIAGFLKTQRLILGFGALVAEMGGVLVLLLSLVVPDVSLYLFVGFYLLIGTFHIAVFSMAGILVWGNVIVNLSMAYSLFNCDINFDEIRISEKVTALVGMIAVDLYIIMLYKIVESEGNLRKVGIILFDASYLLMCWWDSPYMRMYSYSVDVVENGVEKTYQFPVTKFSPYDTMITDIHTRMSYLHMHTGFDSQRTADLETAHPGVWGLLLIREEAMKMYSTMDSDGQKLKQQLETLSVGSDESKIWNLREETDTSHPAFPLQCFFIGINKSIANKKFNSLFKFIMKWPHFPGEDWVPDACPLSSKLEEFPFHVPIKNVNINRVKTFYTGNDILLLEDSRVGVIHLPCESDDRNLNSSSPPQLSESDFIDGMDVHRVGR